MVNVLFVCLGNICRSPTAEGILERMVTQAGFSKDICIDSAGTSAYHIGQKADIRSRQHAQKRGYELRSRARQFTTDDFNKFDMILTMDESNYFQVTSLSSNPMHTHKIHQFMSFCPHYKNVFSNVPDPYYDGDKGFETVLDIIEEGCTELLNQINLKESVSPSTLKQQT